jgi:imidazolonepropionase-like amidohydrolase
MKWAFLMLLAACGSSPRVEPPLPAPPGLVLRGVTLVDGRVVDLVIGGDGRFAAGPPPVGTASVELTGMWVVPAFIDSHVHLAYLPAESELASGGVAAAVDLAAPVSFLGDLREGRLGALRVIASGPMLTAPGGYPLASWGKDGYGIPCADVRCAAETVRTLHGKGARVVKLAITKPPVLDDASLRAAVDEAHRLELKVAAHALRDEDARRAAAAGADLLAHTPVAPLAPATLASWRGRAVVSTIAAFGAEPSAVANLAALRQGGVTVLYGTDLGNSQVKRIDGAELGHLVAAGLDGLAVLEAGTRAPAAYWGFTELGSLEPGKEASLLVLDGNPQVDPMVLARPARVMIRGAWR